VRRREAAALVEGRSLSRATKRRGGLCPSCLIAWRMAVADRGVPNCPLPEPAAPNWLR